VLFSGFKLYLNIEKLIPLKIGNKAFAELLDSQASNHPYLELILSRRDSFIKE